MAATPAKAGAQLGNIANEGLPFITLAFPPGPRPSPGWWFLWKRPAPSYPLPFRERVGVGAWPHTAALVALPHPDPPLKGREFGAELDQHRPLPDQAAFIDAMSMTKRYLTSLFTMR